MKELEERIQRFKGLVIKVAGKSDLERTMTVRRKIGAFGVEKVFAIHSTTIQKIDISHLPSGMYTVNFTCGSISMNELLIKY